MNKRNCELPAFSVLALYLTGILIGEYLQLDLTVQIFLIVFSFLCLIQVVATEKISIRTCLLILVFINGIIRSAHPQIGIIPWEWYYWFEELVTPIRDKLVEGMTNGLNKKLGDLVVGIVLGRGGGTIYMPDWPHFVKSGLSHLLVASGAQVSLMVFPVILIAENVPVTVRVKSILFALAGILLLLLLFLIGEEPSILRAITACYLYLAARIINRKAHSLNIVYVTALFWLWIDPSLIRDIGFQLSYVASWGLIYIYPRLRQFDIVKRTRRVKTWRESPARYLVKYPLEIFLLSFSAQVAVIPVLAYNFNRISVAGFISNILALPLSEFLTYMALFTSLVNLISGSAAQFLNSINSIPLHWMDSIASIFSRVPLMKGVKIHWLGLIIPYVFTGLFIEAKFRPHIVVLFMSYLHTIVYPAERMIRMIESVLRKHIKGNTWGA